MRGWSWTYYHYAYTNQCFGTTKLTKKNGKRHKTTHNEDRILGAGPPSNRLCIMKLHELFYNTFVVCLCIHADAKALSTYLIRFGDGKRYLVVDCNRYRNRNGDPLSTPLSYGASETPSSLQHLCESLVQTSFGASLIAIWREKHKNTILVD